MATTLDRNNPTVIIAITNANEAEEIDWDGKPPRFLTLNFQSNAGAYDFFGPATAQLSSQSRVPVDANSPYTIELRSGMARNLSLTSLFIEADAASTDVDVSAVW